MHITVITGPAKSGKTTRANALCVTYGKRGKTVVRGALNTEQAIQVCKDTQITGFQYLILEQESNAEPINLQTLAEAGFHVDDQYECRPREKGEVDPEPTEADKLRAFAQIKEWLESGATISADDPTRPVLVMGAPNIMVKTPQAATEVTFDPSLKEDQARWAATAAETEDWKARALKAEAQNAATEAAIKRNLVARREMMLKLLPPDKAGLLKEFWDNPAVDAFMTELDASGEGKVEASPEVAAAFGKLFGTQVDTVTAIDHGTDAPPHLAQQAAANGQAQGEPESLGEVGAPGDPGAQGEGAPGGDGEAHEETDEETDEEDDGPETEQAPAEGAAEGAAPKVLSKKAKKKAEAAAKKKAAETAEQGK